jgi:hypothetical protein
VETGFPRDKRETRLRADHAQTKRRVRKRNRIIEVPGENDDLRSEVSE